MTICRALGGVGVWVHLTVAIIKQQFAGLWVEWVYGFILRWPSLNDNLQGSGWSGFMGSSYGGHH